MKWIQMGNAVCAPSSPAPSGRLSSYPTQTVASSSGV